MSFKYGINRFLGLQGTQFEVHDMDVKPGKTTFTIKHREPAHYICKWPIASEIHHPFA